MHLRHVHATEAWVILHPTRYMHGRKTLQNSERGDTNSTWEQSCIDDASKVQKTVLVHMRARTTGNVRSI